MTVSAVKIIQPGEIQGLPDDETPLLVLPIAIEVFKGRIARLEDLSKKGVLKDWLDFCAHVTKAQLEAIDQIAVNALEENVIVESLKHGMPPASIGAWRADKEWHDALKIFTDALAKQALPAPARKVLEQFQSADATDLQQQAQDYLQADETKVKPEWAPFIGAILQIIWMKKIVQLTPYAASYKGQSTLCPVCGSHPVASVVRVGLHDGHRYLSCSLCSAEWYAARARCTNCETPKEVSMLGEAKESLIQGECCDDCHGYLKIMYQARDPMMDVVADDLASIQVDFGLSSEGYQRTGRNMLLMAAGETDQKDS
jgi:FdhE protein